MNIFEKRSVAGSDAYFVANTPVAWSDWTISKGVKEGYKINGWLYRAATILAQAASSVPWEVTNTVTKTPEPGHPLNVPLKRPNLQYSRQKLFEVLTLWVMLGGNAYLKKVMLGENTAELWPVSPDRIGPIPSKDKSKFIDGYKIIQDGGREENDPTYNEQTVLHFLLTDPSNPYLGIAPISAAAKAVDIDNKQQTWNHSVMGNRAVVDGVFTFKRTLDKPTVTGLIERLKERYSGPKNARVPLVIGDEAHYTRLGLNPVELDYLNSRKANRDEIFGIFGVPPQLGGAMESMTYNNYSAAMKIMWVSSVIPLLDMFKDTLNTSFAPELGESLSISYDLTNVSALKTDEADKFKTALDLYKMRIPVSVINKRLELGLDEYPGWDTVVADPAPIDQSAEDETKKPPPTDPDAKKPTTKLKSVRSFKLVPLEQRSVDSETKLRDDLAENEVFDAINAILEKTRDAVMPNLMTAPEAEVSSLKKEWERVLTESYLLVGMRFASTVVEMRALVDDEDIQAALEFALQQEGVILKDLSNILASTVTKIVDQVKYGINAGWGIAQIQQAILDTGVFSPERALTIARTTAGTAASIGQMTAGAKAGATHKEWVASYVETREAHAARDGEIVPIDGRFSAQLGGVGPRYPLDPNIPAGDRINCRCYMTFSIQ